MLTAAVSTATPAEAPAGDDAVTPTLDVVAVAASRTPGPTMAPGPLERAVSKVTDAAGVAGANVEDMYATAPAIRGDDATTSKM